MNLSKPGLTKLLIYAALILNLFSSIFSQQVVLNINSIEENEKGFLVKGIVIMSNLNPGGQIVESDNCSIIADIKTGTDSVFPLLPDAMSIRMPANVETSFRKGKKYLTKKEYYGEKIVRLVLFGISPRGNNIWRSYGGLGVWRKNAPNCVTRKFEGVIPKKFGGKTVRIRASLRHQWGGPFAAWSAISFRNDIGHEGILKSENIKKPDSHKIYITNGPAGSPNPVGTGGSVQCKITAKDTRDHKLLYKWTVKPQAGSFSDPNVSSPVWTSPVNTMDKMRSYSLSCTITCSADITLKETGSFVQDVCPVIKPVSIILRISADGFETYEQSSKPFIPRYKKLILAGSVMPAYRNSDEAGIIGSESKVFAELIVMSEGKEIRANRIWVKMYSDYWLSVDLSQFAGCTKKKEVIRERNIRLQPVGQIKKDKITEKKPNSMEIYEKILSERFGKKKGFKKIWEMLGLYKAYQNDKVHIMSGGKGTPALKNFFNNLKQGRVGEIKNAVNTLWEFTKAPLTLGGSAVEDMIQNTNKAWKRIFGEGFLKKQKKGENSIKDAGTALKYKLEQLQKALEAK